MVFLMHPQGYPPPVAGSSREFGSRHNGTKVANSTGTMTPPVHTTMLDLVRSVTDVALSENEVIATVTYLVNSGKVVLVGNFAGARLS